MATTKTLQTAVSTGAGRQAFDSADVSFPDVGSGRSVGVVGVLSETIPVASFTDGGAAVGTYQMVGSVPVGAVLLGSKVLVPGGFSGDTTAVMTIGDGSDVDRYNTSTINVFTTAPAGVESGVPSGLKLMATANRPTLTITGGSDFTSIVTAAAGIVTVNIYYTQTG